jgi:hypothetical protein
MMHLQNQNFFVVQSQGMSSIRSSTMAPIILALRVTLRLNADKPSTHQNACGSRFMSGDQMDKGQHKNILTQKIGLAMHK